ncbi:DUF4349 domain-containing protein [Microtetraspora sp. NBRC 16547]|uniref:DUF4349 domain-containing protein n=1 Tax=Microtetraspora sp. NBRC 16547 TaxID=3030993 RepID=UPI0024A580B8|nr:DUF4349 domain-containing protein [Microtetraspora sp. NBRC 16547]GLW96646.1 lipoprotein [Microtetraspora sp. NBRC 16547]
MTRFRYGTAVIVTAAFLLSGCGGVDGGSSPAVARDEAASAPQFAQADPASGGAGAGADSTGKSARTPQKAKIALDDRAVIYTAQLTVRVKDVTAAADQAKQIVTGAGGYVSEERSNSYSKRDEAVIAFKIPPAGYPDVLARLSRDLGKRESLNQGAQDVTEEVADVASRVKSAESALGQFRTLLSKAQKIGEILEIEREISSREAELEALQARQKALAAQTGMATVTLNLAGPAATPPKPKPKKTSGFLAGLDAGWTALVTAVGIGLTVLGVLLPWLVLAAILGLPFYLVRRRAGTRRTARTEAPRAEASRTEAWQEEDRPYGDTAGSTPAVEHPSGDGEDGSPRTSG